MDEALSGVGFRPIHPPPADYMLVICSYINECHPDVKLFSSQWAFCDEKISEGKRKFRLAHCLDGEQIVR